MDILESQHRKIIIILVIVILAGGVFWMLKHFHPALFLGEPDLVVETETAPPLSTSPSPPASSVLSPPPQPSVKKSAPSDGSRININTATSQELQTLPRIGPTLAQRIIEYRQTSGGFSTVDDLTNVKGIGEKTLEKIRDRITAIGKKESGTSLSGNRSPMK